MEAQLNRLTPGEFDRWVAFHSIEPDAEKRLREIVKLGFCALANAWGAKIEPKDIDPWHKQNEADVITDAGEAVKFLKQTYGA